MKLTNVGTMYGGLETASPVHKKPEMNYPTIHLDKIPEELMGKDVGAMCRLEIVVEIKRKAINEEDNKKTKSMRLDVHKVGLIGPAGKKSQEEYLKMNPADREAYDSEQIYSK